jgi:hypothetical protein
MVLEVHKTNLANFTSSNLVPLRNWRQQRLYRRILLLWLNKDEQATRVEVRKSKHLEKIKVALPQDKSQWITQF